MHKERIEQEKLLKMIQKTFGDFSRLNQLEEENELLKKNQVSKYVIFLASFKKLLKISYLLTERD